MSLTSAVAARSRARLLTSTYTLKRDDVIITTAAGRIVPLGTEQGAYAPVQQAIQGLGGARSRHLGLLEGTVAARNGDTLHDGSDTYMVAGVTNWQGLTALALELVR